ncbi:uncharacterized protein LOC131237866 isoform X3 [Magnolia sinica]|uniref:uncharacterized protein LOC131237866 isoform X3 n=1 Tax=Magnolia sinica TaxID=86752 RepID=UPI00265AC7F3|nr:uncharacterized protein LOC131237866 isoform X3 [Magnolia sinica]
MTFRLSMMNLLPFHHHPSICIGCKGWTNHIIHGAFHDPGHSINNSNQDLKKIQCHRLAQPRPRIKQERQASGQDEVPTNAQAGPSSGRKPRKPRKFRPGTVALWEIQKYQKSCELLIPADPFIRCVGRVEQGTIKVGEDVEILGLMQVGQEQATCTAKELREIPGSSHPIRDLDV